MKPREIVSIIFALAINLVVDLYILLYLPPERTLGELYKIIYVHVPAAWVSYVAFTTALICSTLYIFKKKSKYDLLSFSSVGLGVFFSGLAILLGMIFSNKAWGTYWEWREPRITSTFILFLTYVGYLALRASIGDLEKRRSISSVYSIMAFVTIPLSYVSIKIFRSIHPLPELSPIMRIFLYISFFTTIALYIVLLDLLYRKFSIREAIILGGEES